MAKVADGYVELRSESSRFAVEAKEQISRILDSIRATVQLAADGSGFRADVSRTVAAAAAGQEAVVDVVADAGRLPAEVATAAAAAEAAAPTVNVKVDVDRSSLDRLGDSLGKVGKEGNVLKSVFGGGFSFLGAAVPLAGQAAVALTSLGGGIVAVTGSLAPLVGLAGAVPAALGGIGLAAGVLKLGLGGVAEAVGLLGKAQAVGAKEAKDHAAAVVAAADAVTSARDALAAARVRQSDLAVDGPRQIEQAERSLERSERDLALAQRAQQIAQEDLTRARRDAKRQIDDLNEAVEDGVLSEKEAILALARAKHERDLANNDPRRNALDRQGAELAVERAEDRLEDVRRQRVRDVADAADANSKGVEGSDRVRDARQAEADATQRVADAGVAVADAARNAAVVQRDVARAQITAAHATEQAQHAVTRALEQQAEVLASIGPAGDAAKAALDGLSEPARTFALYLASLRPILKTLKEDVGAAFLPGVQDGIRSMVTGLLPIFSEALVKSGKGIGDWVRQLGTMVSAGPFAADVRTILNDTIGLFGKLGDATLLFIDGMRNFAVAAGPMVSAIGDISKELGAGFRDATARGRESGGLARFFDQTIIALRLTISLTGQFFRLIGNVLKAAAPLGNDILGGTADRLKRLADAAGSVAGQTKLTAFFDKLRPVLAAIAHLVGAVVKGFFRLVDSVDTGLLAKALNAIADKILPAIVDLLIRAQPLGDAILRLIIVLAENEGFLKGLAAGFSLVVGFVVKFIDLVTWIIDNVPGAGPILGGILGSLIAIKLIGSFTPVIGGLNLIGGAIRTLSAVIAAEGVLGKLKAIFGVTAGARGGAAAGSLLSAPVAGGGAAAGGAAAAGAGQAAAGAAAGGGLAAVAVPVAIAGAILAGLAVGSRVANKVVPGLKDFQEERVDKLATIPIIGKPLAKINSTVLGVRDARPPEDGKTLGDDIKKAFGRADDAAERFFKGIPGQLGRARSSIASFARGIPGALGGAAGTVAARIVGSPITTAQGIGRLAGAVRTGAPVVVREARRLGGQVGEAVTSFVASAPGRITRFVDRAGGILSRLPGQAQRAVSGLPATIGGAIESARDRTEKGVNRIIGTVRGLDLGGRAKDIMRPFVDGFKKGWADVNKDTDGAANRVVGKVKDIGSRIVGIARDVAEGGERLGRFLLDSASRLDRFGGEVRRRVVAIGQAIAAGIIEGIRSGAGGVINAARDLAGSAVDAARRRLDARSPSRVFVGIGRNIVEGLVEGIDGQGPKAQEALSRLAGSLKFGAGRMTGPNLTANLYALANNRPPGDEGGAGAGPGRGGDTYQFGPFIGSTDRDLPTAIPRELRKAQYVTGRRAS